MIWADILLFARFIMNRLIFGRLNRVAVACKWYKEKVWRFILQDKGPRKKRLRIDVVSREILVWGGLKSRGTEVRISA